MNRNRLSRGKPSTRSANGPSRTNPDRPAPTRTESSRGNGSRRGRGHGRNLTNLRRTLVDMLDACFGEEEEEEEEKQDVPVSNDQGNE